MIELTIVCLFFLGMYYGGDVIALLRERQRLAHGIVPAATAPDEDAYDRAEFAGDCARSAVEKGYEVRVRPCDGDRVWVHVIDGETSVLTLTAEEAGDGWGAALDRVDALPARNGAPS